MTKKTAIVTGASGGLASAISRRLSADGWNLVLMSRSGCADLAGELGQTGIAGSVLEDDDVAAAVDCAVRTYGGLNGAVWSGGKQSDVLGDFEFPAPPPVTTASFSFDPAYARDPFDIPFDAWHANYEMFVLGPMRLFRAALPHFRAAGGGTFVAMSGIEAMQPRVPFVLGPNRLALHGFVRLLADRYGPENIRANLIAPGLMDTATADFDPGWKDLVPLCRWGRPEEVAGAVAFLMSEDAGYVTGQTLTADGGINRTPGF